MDNNELNKLLASMPEAIVKTAKAYKDSAEKELAVLNVSVMALVRVLGEIALRMPEAKEGRGG